MAKIPASASKAKSVPGKTRAKAPAKAGAKRKPASGKGRRSHSSGEERLQRLADAVQAVREGRLDSPRTARLLGQGVPKMAQKVVEEAGEVAIEAVLNRRETLIQESVDLFYNLAILWNGAGVGLQDLWSEMDRREAALGMAEKLPKTDES